MNSAGTLISSSVIGYGLLVLVILTILGLVLTIFKRWNRADDDHRHRDAQVSAFIYDPSNYWFHWKYSQEDKLWISRYEFSIGLLILVFSPVLFGLLCLGFGIYDLITHPMYYEYPLQEILNRTYTGVIFGGVVGIIGLIFSGGKAFLSLLEIEDVYIGSAGICHGGKYFNFNDPGCHLSAVELVGKTLEFRFEHDLPEDKQDKSFRLSEYRSEMERSETSLRTVYVPLGRESEALEVIKRLELICPEKPPVVRVDPYDYDDDDRHFNDYYSEDRDDDDPIGDGEESDESDNDSED